MLIKNFRAINNTSSGYIINADNADIMLVFLSDDVIRVRVSFARAFRECSYALITTAWADELDNLFAGERTRINALNIDYQENEKNLTFTTKTLRLVMNKSPLNFALYNNEGTIHVWTEKKISFTGSARRPGILTKNLDVCECPLKTL